MTIPQTSYASSMDVGFAGQILDLGPKLVESFINAEATALPFGIAMMRGAAAASGPGSTKNALLPTGPHKEIIGIVGHSHVQKPIGLTGTQGVPVKGEFNALVTGPILVLVEEDVLEGDPAFVRYATGVADNTKTQKGAFRKSHDTGTAFRLNGAKFECAASAGGLALVRRTADQSPSHFLLEVANASVSATTTVQAFLSDPTRHMVLTAVNYFNATGLAIDTSNYFALALHVASTAGNGAAGDVATLSTHDTAVTSATYIPLALNAVPVIPPNVAVTFVMTKTGTQTLPAGYLVLAGYYV